MSDLRSAFVEAADHVIAIVARDDVRAAWHGPSALADWSVGGLVAHFAAQLRSYEPDRQIWRSSS